MFEGLASELVTGGLGSLIFLLGFFGGVYYMSKVYVRKEELMYHIETHEKELGHTKALFEEKFEYIKKGIEEIKETLKKINA